MLPNEGKLLGRGLNFPPKIGASGRFAWSSGSENIQQSIRVILLTEPHERLMLPQFGGGLQRFLFKPNTLAIHRLIEETITQSLTLWEPRIQLESVTIEPVTDNHRAVLVTIRYQLVATQVNDQVQFNFLFAS